MRSIVMGRIWMSVGATIVSAAGGFGAAVAQEQNMPGWMDRGMSGRGMTMCRMDEHIHGQLAHPPNRVEDHRGAEPAMDVFASTFRTDKEKNARLCRATENEKKSRAKTMSASLPESLGMMAARLTVRPNRCARWRRRYSRFIRF